MVMLVSEEENYEQYLDDAKWIAELKRDGNRIELHYNREKDELRFLNRKGEDYTKGIPDEVLNDLKERLAKDDYVTSFIIDGELTYTDIKGRDHRTQAQCPDADPILWVWDIQELNGENLRELTWLERKTELKTVCEVYQFFYNDFSNIRWVPYYMQKRELLKLAEENKMEGIVLKNVDAKYEDGKTKSQIKVKFAETDDFIVIGYVEASGTKTGKREKYFGALLLAQYGYYDIDVETLKPKGRVGGGFNDNDLEEITPLLQKNRSYIYEHSNINDKSYGLAKGKCQFLHPSHWFVVEVKYHGLTEYGKPFQPRFVKLRPDKKIEECIENE